ncbi:hypothetical protein JB92DRAFT_3098038 [Gautieria morchelliformis]|nr:hypothetical protein JB92DRAFT_3098038 [Gautieria morchelliformis]
MYLPFEVWSHVFSKAIPQLWTHLHTGHPHQFADPTGLWKWLGKSGECPLDVVLKVPLGVTDLRPTLVVLHGHVRRFRVLNIDAPTSEELCIITIDEKSDRHADEDRDYFAYAFYPSPRLRRPTISPPRMPAPSSTLISTVSALMIVSGPDDQGTPIEWVLNIIAAIPHLKYLNYSGYHFFSFQTSHSLDYPHVELLPHLEAVDVTVPGCGLDILRCLEVPTLRSVRLYGSRGDGYAEDWNDEGVTNVSVSLKCLPQRAPGIQKLDLHRIEELQADTSEWLSARLICSSRRTSHRRLNHDRQSVYPIKFAWPGSCQGMRGTSIYLPRVAGTINWQKKASLMSVAEYGRKGLVAYRISTLNPWDKDGWYSRRTTRVTDVRLSRHQPRSVLPLNPTQRLSRPDVGAYEHPLRASAVLGLDQHLVVLQDHIPALQPDLNVVHHCQKRFQRGEEGGGHDSLGIWFDFYRDSGSSEQRFDGWGLMRGRNVRSGRSFKYTSCRTPYARRVSVSAVRVYLQSSSRDTATLDAIVTRPLPVAVLPVVAPHSTRDSEARCTMHDAPAVPILV